jgi:type IV secretion system protein VirD4
MTPGEIMRLPADECLILARTTPPIRARKLRYFAIPQLSALIAPPPPLILSPQPAPDWRNRVWRPEAADVPDVVPASQPSHSHQAGKGSIPDLFDEDPRGSHSLSEAT